MKKRPSQGTHQVSTKEGSCRRRLKEDSRRLKCQKKWRSRVRRGLTEAQKCKTGPDQPASRSSAPESGPRVLMRRRVGFKPPRKNCTWEARGSVFGSGALRKVANFLFALLMMWSVSENIVGKKVARKVSGKYHWKNIDGDEGFLTTIWLTRKL